MELWKKNFNVSETDKLVTIRRKDHEARENAEKENEESLASNQLDENKTEVKMVKPLSYEDKFKLVKARFLDHDNDIGWSATYQAAHIKYEEMEKFMRRRVIQLKTVPGIFKNRLRCPSIQMVMWC